MQNGENAGNHNDLTLFLICQFWSLPIQLQTRAITERDHTPQHRIVIEQVLVTEWRMV